MKAIDNRTAPDKRHGLVVDYYGVSTQLTEALAAYMSDGQMDPDAEAALRPLTTEIERLEPQRQRVRQLFVVPSLRAWGNVPSARHRHSVRRLTPTRSSTSGTRNMASVDTLSDMSAPFTVGTSVTSMRGDPSRRVVGRLAHHVEGSGVDQDAVAAEVAVGRHAQRHSDGGGACAATDGAGPRGGDRAV